MKARILSDLHMEHAPFLYQYQGEDVVFLAGDIHSANRTHEILEQIEIAADIPVFGVIGNHELYDQVFDDVIDYHIAIQNRFPNYTFLNNSTAEYQGIPIYGGAMFTDFKLYGETDEWFAKQSAKLLISDFRDSCIRTSLTKQWTTTDHTNQFDLFVAGLKQFLADYESASTKIVISHFMPSPQCIHPNYTMSTINGYFAANMESYMGWNGYWFAGHGHNSVSTSVHDTKIIINPKGYHDQNKQFNPNLIIEI